MKNNKNKLVTTPPVIIKGRASKKTAKAIRFYNGKIPATDLLEESKASKKLRITPPRNSVSDKFFNWLEDAPIGKWVGLALTTAFIVAVAYWGIKQ